MKKVIAYTRVSKSVREQLKKKYEVTYFENYEYINDPEFLKALKEASGIIGLELKVTEELLNYAPNLEIVSNVSVGYDNLDINAMTKRNIMATNTPGVLTNTVADAVFGIMLATARRIPELNTFVKNGNWKEYLQLEHFGTDVHNKTIGIIGMGSIGEAIAKRSHFGFDMNVLYHNRSRKEHVEKVYNATYCSLNELLEQSDFVCLMVPSTPETERMIGENEFKRMKQSAIFINGSRGKNVDEKALYQALINNEILAAGLDVFEKEPVNPDNPLLKLDNVIALPHIGAATRENELAMSMLAAKNLEMGLLGKCPPNIINREAYYDDHN
ncbi:2-hydroxyacid dehydrogenase [Virgibacillus sp. W0430]|uniref:2-hydroxyacid dehydrogenase n=1 Tax=Virgibacillus sp. W0430 TaxID=3391580 RepID=UPI003F45760D